MLYNDFPRLNFSFYTKNPNGLECNYHNKRPINYDSLEVLGYQVKKTVD